MNLEFRLLDLGKVSYEDAWQVQQDFFQERIKGKRKDTLIFAEHHPTISLGLNEEWNKMHVTEEEMPEAVKLVRSNRGGGAAYLGPGILVGYTIMDIRPYGGVRKFLTLLEEVMIKTAGDFGIKVGRHDAMNPTTDKPYRATWYTENGKNCVLCTKGIKAQIWTDGTYIHHGFALNVNRVEPTYFHLIDPCGFPTNEVQPISMNEIVKRELDMNQVKEKLVQNFQEVLYPKKVKELTWQN